MYLIVSNDQHFVLGFCEELNRQENGNILCNDYAISTTIIEEILEVDIIPDYVTPMDYILIDGEFIPVSEIPPTEEDELADAIAALELLGVSPEEGTNNG